MVSNKPLSRLTSKLCHNSSSFLVINNLKQLKGFENGNVCRLWLSCMYLHSSNQLVVLNFGIQCLPDHQMCLPLLPPLLNNLKAISSHILWKMTWLRTILKSWINNCYKWGHYIQISEWLRDEYYTTTTTKKDFGFCRIDLNIMKLFYFEEFKKRYSTTVF